MHTLVPEIVLYKHTIVDFAIPTIFLIELLHLYPPPSDMNYHMDLICKCMYDRTRVKNNCRFISISFYFLNYSPFVA